MMGPTKQEAEQQKSERTKAREAFFIQFAHAIRKELPDVLLMVTGGLRSRTGIESAIQDNACDLVGIGRPAVLNTAYPKEVLLNSEVAASEATLTLPKVDVPWLVTKLGLQALTAGATSVCYFVSP
jgi:2,4-dienoyl-CoA reductase-like NADH-dependent reductase (Old Yellow Enzyme family)